MRHPVIHTDETFNQNIKRLMLFYNRLAIQYLQRETNIHENIHQTRLCFKRMRSFLRMGRTGLGEDNYKKFNIFYRDQSRALSQLRDVTALIETLPIFIKTRRSNAARGFLLKFKKELEGKRREQLKSIISLNIKAEVINNLEIKSAEISQWRFIGDSAEVFITGAQRIYSRGKRFFKITLSNPDAHNMHEWRKQVKYFWYHIGVLNPVWPGVMTAWAKEVQTLSQWLGKHHDLVMLENAISTLEPEPKLSAYVRNLMNSIQLRKRSLELRCLSLGKKLYAEKPVAFKERMLIYWQ